MIKSMTGFGRGEANDGKRNITVEIKTVNHRYSDITVKMPRRYSFIEDKVKKAIKENVKRARWMFPLWSRTSPKAMSTFP
jgi:uncharacterized protein (TIGR00255 family)